MKQYPFSPASLGTPGLCLIAALQAACSWQDSSLGTLTSGGPLAPPDAVASDDKGDTAIARDAPAGAPDVFAGPGSGDTPAATDGVAGRDSPTEIGGTKNSDGSVATAGADGSDVPVATGGAGTGGTAGAGDAAGPTGGTQAAAGSGGAVTGGAGGDTGTASGGGSQDSSRADAGVGSGGQAATGGSAGGSAVDAAAGTGSGGNGGGGQKGSGGVDGGAGTGGTDGAGGAAGAGGNACNGHCPLIATIGITGPWGATYSDDAHGNLVTAGDTAFLTWLATRAANCTVQNLDISGNNYLTAARIAPYKTIVVLDIYHTQGDKDAFFKAKKTSSESPSYPGTQRTILSSEVSAVRDWVNNGGGLMTTIGIVNTVAEMANANLLLAPFGIAYSVTNVNVLPGNSSISAFSTAPPIASQITAGVGALRVSSAAAIEGIARTSLPANSSIFSLYASGGDSLNYAIGVAEISGAGRVNVWGDEWITYDGGWTGTHGVDLQTYWSNVITWLGQCP